MMTGCNKNANMMCTLTKKDDDHTNDYILSATFEENKLKTMALSGTSVYTESDSTEAAYAVIKEGYDQLTKLDSSIETEVFYANEKLYFRMRLYTDKISDDGLKYLQGIFKLEKGYPDYNDFMNYAKESGYKCN